MRVNVIPTTARQESNSKNPPPGKSKACRKKSGQRGHNDVSGGAPNVSNCLAFVHEHKLRDLIDNLDFARTAVELARLIAQRVAERDASSSENEESTPATTERSLDSIDPRPADRNHEQRAWYPPTAS
jgi:hypothetical protein